MIGKNIFRKITIVSLLSVGALLATSNVLSQQNDRLGTPYLPDESMEIYFDEIGKMDSDEEKDNALIVMAANGIGDSYGAKNIIEAPNNQYILQYNSAEEKEVALRQLKEDAKIEGVAENDVYTIDAGDYDSWGIEKMSLDHAIDSAEFNNDNMQPVTVAIIDTGCDMPLFNKYYGGKIAEVYDILEQSATTITDEHGHGTHIAGTIAEGTPSNVKILPIKVSKTSDIYITDIIAAINYIVYNNKAQVINMSFGGYGYNEALDQAIESARQQNIISVAAAGNDNTDARSYPAASANTISIASVDLNLEKSTFSNYGAEINFVAPGTNIRSIMSKSATISKNKGNNDDDDHEIISGTSMATPHAAAAVAILKGYNKDLTLENVIDILKDNAQDLGEKGWDQYYGNGLISFRDVEFCDGTYCNELGVYKDLNKRIASIDATDLNLTRYNYYSVTNLMGSKVVVTYTDGTSEEMAIGGLPNVEISNYDPTASGSQMITIKVGSLTETIQVANPDGYESGWEYNTLPSGQIEITGYKNHDLEIERLYVPEAIDSKQVVSFADDFKFAESGNDAKSYVHLYLPDTFTRIGNYSLAGANIKYIYGSSDIEIGDHAFENSAIVSISAPVTRVGDYAFKDCFELSSINISGIFRAVSASHTQVAETYIGDYAFYNCKKLSQITKAKYDTIFVNKIGAYAFYNDVLLSRFDLTPHADIGDYAFYGTYLLPEVDLYNSDNIGEFAFYGSGIMKANFSVGLSAVGESAFENCRNLKDVSFVAGRIESRAFWNSGVETIHLADDVEYIAEDAFAYTPMKESSDIGNHGTGNYKTEYNLGVVELSTNKLLIGFTGNLGASNTDIPDYITKIGNYAFTGNNNLERITIPATVTEIGTYAFKDCYQLSDVYMLGDSINFGDDAFVKTHEGEMQNADLKIYVHKDSETKQFVKNKNLNYRHIEPDEVIVTNYEDTYEALSQVDWKNLGVKLIYHEEEDREEVLGTIIHKDAPISNGVGFSVSYQTDNRYERFQYGDTYFVVQAKNEVGYLSTQNIEVVIKKATPTYTVPTGLTADVGQQLSEVTLPEHFEWMDQNQTISEPGEGVYKAKYVPADTNNYETIENIDITIMVSDSQATGGSEAIITSEIYDIVETDKYINKIIVNTTPDNFTSNIAIGLGCEIDVDTKTINSQQVLYTGGKTRITCDQDHYAEYTNVVTGDVNGDGAINSADLLRIRQHLLSLNILSGAYFIASDINDDESINSADLLRVRQHLLGVKPIE